MIFISKVVNNGYGNMVKGFEEVQITEEMVKKIWSLRENRTPDDEQLDDLMDSTGFTWNVVSDKEEKSLLKKLQEKRVVCREYEDTIVCVGDNREQVLEELLKNL
jgi:hypothetical protein